MSVDLEERPKCPRCFEPLTDDAFGTGYCGSCGFLYDIEKAPGERD